MGRVIEPRKNWFLYYTTLDGNTFGLAEKEFTYTDIKKFCDRLQKYENDYKSGVVWYFKEIKR